MFHPLSVYPHEIDALPLKLCAATAKDVQR